eukprot:8195166-Pyramimonas_sp.AAC.1
MELVERAGHVCVCVCDQIPNLWSRCRPRAPLAARLDRVGNRQPDLVTRSLGCPFSARGPPVAQPVAHNSSSRTTKGTAKAHVVVPSIRPKKLVLAALRRDTEQ